MVDKMKCPKCGVKMEIVADWMEKYYWCRKCNITIKEKNK